MREGQPSRTAERVALRRAAHQVLDEAPHVLEDPLAPRILSEEQRAELSRDVERQQHPYSRAMRAFMVTRSRYAEDALARAVAAGVRQYVVLGAGLDTFAYRNPFAGLRVFEVDHPSTQAWKRERLAAAAIPIPPDVTFAPVDFESQSLAEGLAAVGFQRAQPAFFSWLGVTPYLTLSSFRDTLRFIAAQPPGSGLAFDYALAREELDETRRAALDALAGRVASLGEPFQLFFSPVGLETELTGAGFTQVENLDGDDLHARYFAQRGDGLGLRSGAGRLASAWVTRQTEAA